METHKDELIKIITQEKYDEELDVIKKMVIQETNKGVFEAIEGDIDCRDKALKDLDLMKGFGTQCGIKGGKLSGGQK